MSNFRILFDGVSDSARPSQRLVRIEVDVEAESGVGGVVVEADFGKYERSRTRTARQLDSVVQPTIFAVTQTKELGDGILTFCHRLPFSKKQKTENCTGAA